MFVHFEKGHGFDLFDVMHSFKSYLVCKWTSVMPLRIYRVYVCSSEVVLFCSEILPP